MLFLIVFRLRDLFLELCESTSVRLSKLHFRCPAEESEPKSIYSKTYISIHFRNSSKTFGSWGKNISAGSSFLISRCPEERFEEKNLFEKIKIFDHFISLTGKYFGFSAKTLRQVCRNGILRVLGNVLRNFLRKRTYIFLPFQIFERKFRTLGRNTSSGLSKKPSTCPREHFEELFLGKNYILLPFPHFEEKNFGFSAKVSSRFIKTVFNGSRRMFWGFFEKIQPLHHFCTLGNKTNQLLAESF